MITADNLMKKINGFYTLEAKKMVVDYAYLSNLIPLYKVPKQYIINISEDEKDFQNTDKKREYNSKQFLKKRDRNSNAKELFEKKIMPLVKDFGKKSRLEEINSLIPNLEQVINIYEQEGLYDKAAEYLMTLLKIYAVNKDVESEKKCSYKLIDDFLKDEDFDSALIFAKDLDQILASDIYKKGMDFFNKNKYLCDAGNLAMIFGNYEEAMKIFDKEGLFFEASSAAEKLGNKEKMLNFYEKNNDYDKAGDLAVSMNQLKKALINYEKGFKWEKAMLLADKIGDNKLKELYADSLDLEKKYSEKTKKRKTLFIK